ncbi:MAG TPA: glycoside hydrolase family 18 protein, partial [Candidatus Babeliaceae bacterium]|nr:glycoside hydrolase family 18 protein [Candidatus Babeliaceae bacterium]
GKQETLNRMLFDPWSDIEYRTDWNSNAQYWGNFKQFQELKSRYPHLKTLVSFGGWTLSDHFSDIAAKDSRRKKFAKLCINFAKKYGFDGIDIDWEYPGFEKHKGKPEDKQNFTLLLKELHDLAKAQTPKLLLTIAAPAGHKNIDNMEVEKIHNYLDFINLMGYDFHGPWEGEQDTVTNHNAPLVSPQYGDPKFCVKFAVEYYLKKGVPANKLVLGMPLYGRSYAGVDSSKVEVPGLPGLYRPYTEPGEGTTAEEKGMVLISDIKNNLLYTYKRYWDPLTKVPYLFNNQEFISYDDEESLAIKAEYAKSKGLKGVMVWELENDPSIWQALTAIRKAFL